MKVSRITAGTNAEMWLSRCRGYRHYRALINGAVYDWSKANKCWDRAISQAQGKTELNLARKLDVTFKVKLKDSLSYSL